MVGRLASLDRASRRTKTTKDALLLSYRLEFCLLNPALTALLSYVRTASGRTTAMALYEDHLNGFIGALRKYGRGSPEMDILGETIHRLGHILEAVADVADTMRRRIEQRPTTDTPLTISVGVASGLITGEVESAVKELIDLADHRLLFAKQAGKNTVVAA